MVCTKRLGELNWGAGGEFFRREAGGTDAQHNPSAKCAPEKPPSAYIPLEGVDAARYQATTDHNHIIHHRRLSLPSERYGTTI